MGFKVHFKRLSFQRTDADNPMVPVGDPVVLQQGEDVPDWVQPAIISALANSGMILPVRSPEDAPIVEDAAPALPNPEVLPRLASPDLTPAEMAAQTETVTPAEPVAKPKDSDTKPMWEAYAESIGIDRAEAESLTKAKLQERVTEREAELAREQAPAV